MAAMTLRLVAISVACLAAAAQATSAQALTLMEAYDAALINDPTYRSAQRENDAGKQFAVIGKSNLLPNVSANYSTGKNEADITTSTALGDRFENRNYTSLNASIQLRQPLFHPEGLARYRQGNAQTNFSDAQFLARRQDLILRLFGLYSTAKYAEDQLAQATAQRDAFSEQRKANVRLLDRGEGTRTDVLETQAKFDQAEATVLEARDSLVNARAALAVMVGQDVTALDNLSSDFKLRPMLPETFEAWKELALAGNAEIAAQRYTVEVASEELKKNQAGHSPRLDLVANISRSGSDTINSFNQSANIRSIGIQLNLPLYAGGAVSASVSQSASNLEKAKADLDSKTSQVLVELRKQYNLTLSSVLRIGAAEKSLASARLLVEATQKSVKGGQRTNLDVLNAQQQSFEAIRDLALARYNYLLAFLRLRFSAGTLTQGDLKDISGYFVADR